MTTAFLNEKKSFTKFHTFFTKRYNLLHPIRDNIALPIHCADR